MKAGAVAVGGCCTTVADHVRQVAAAGNSSWERHEAEGRGTKEAPVHE